VFGRTGWIGGEIGRLLDQQGAKWEYATARLEDRAGILADIERVSSHLVDSIHNSARTEDRLPLGFMMWPTLQEHFH
jgi:hypothetical protein